MADITSKTALAPLTPKAAERSFADASTGGYSSLPSSIHFGLSEKLQGITEKLQVILCPVLSDPHLPMGHAFFH